MPWSYSVLPLSVSEGGKRSFHILSIILVCAFLFTPSQNQGLIVKNPSSTTLQQHLVMVDQCCPMHGSKFHGLILKHPSSSRTCATTCAGGELAQQLDVLPRPGPCDPRRAISAGRPLPRAIGQQCVAHVARVGENADTCRVGRVEQRPDGYGSHTRRRSGWWTRGRQHPARRWGRSEQQRSAPPLTPCVAVHTHARAHTHGKESACVAETTTALRCVRTGWLVYIPCPTCCCTFVLVCTWNAWPCGTRHCHSHAYRQLSSIATLTFTLGDVSHRLEYYYFNI